MRAWRIVHRTTVWVTVALFRSARSRGPNARVCSAWRFGVASAVRNATSLRRVALPLTPRQESGRGDRGWAHSPQPAPPGNCLPSFDEVSVTACTGPGVSGLESAPSYSDEGFCAAGRRVAQGECGSDSAMRIPTPARAAPRCGRCHRGRENSACGSDSRPGPGCIYLEGASDHVWRDCIRLGHHGRPR